MLELNKVEVSLRFNILEQIEQFLDSENLSIASVCHFMQSIRVLMEIDKDHSNSKYLTTYHYCNWLLHKELDRSSSPKIINEIANSFQNFTTKNDLINKINEALSLKRLIEELKEILWVKISTKIKVSKIDFEEYWLKFLQVILNQILFRPLKLKKENINLDDFQFSIYGLQIVVEKKHYCIELLSKELEMKNKRMVIDIALFREIKV